MEPDHQGSQALASVTLARAGRFLSRFRRAAAQVPTPVVSAPKLWDDELAKAGVTMADWIDTRLARPALYVNVAEPRIDQLRRE
jgi:hypothetical protein